MARRAALLLCLLGGLGAACAGAASAALPNVVVHVGVNPALPGTTAHTGSTVSATCPAGTRLVGGGGYLRNATNPATIPTNGLVLGGSAPGTGSSPDSPGANGTTNPSDWMSIANFTGVAETGDEGETFAMCTTGGPSGTIVETASTTGTNATQQVNPPVVTTATCPSGDQLVGGGAYESTPGQVNDGSTVANGGNLKSVASYPSDSSGMMVADGSADATSWSTYGSSGIPASTDTVTALAVCSTNSSAPRVQVVRSDLVGPNAQAGTTVTTNTVGCPAGTQLISGGFRVDESVGSTDGLEPQQGYHMRGSFPSDAGGAAAVDGTANPAYWTSVGQNGGQTLPTGDHYVTHTFALCAAPALAATSTNVAATEGTAFTGTQVATFTAANASLTASGFSATIDWGDGTATTGTITGSNGSFSVTGGHSYANDGSDPITVNITQTGAPANTATVTATATVAEAALSVSAQAIGATAGAPFSGQVATFTDPNQSAPPGGYAATIDWGDGTSSAGTIAGSAGSFTVSAGHTYAAKGSDTVTVTVREADDAATAVSSTATATIAANPAPVCTAVTAKPRTLWPPNHKFSLVTLSGATDSDGDTLTYAITGVTQDEPVRGPGDKDPDAKAGPTSAGVYLRAERLGKGHGRLYFIAFTVSDGQGGSCSGTLTVAIPHDMHHRAVPDTGARFNSFATGSTSHHHHGGNKHNSSHKHKGSHKHKR